MKRNNCKILLGIGLTALLTTGIAEARQTIVAGSIGAGFEYWDRSFDDESAVNQTSGDKRDFSLSPEIEIRSVGQHNLLAFRYAPAFVYDDLEGETDLDHYLDLSGEHFFNKNWRIDFSDAFVLSEDSNRSDQPFEPSGTEEQEDVVVEPSELTRNLGSTRFWKNDLKISTTYTYAEESDIGTGYNFGLLRNDDDNASVGDSYDEYDRHEVFVLWSYKINAQFSTAIDANYVLGLYDDSEITGLSGDLDEYGVGLAADYQRDFQNLFTAAYKFEASQYDDERQDVASHDLTLSWSHDFDSRTNVTIGGGPSYIDSEDLDGDLGYNGVITYRKAYQHANFFARAKKSFSSRNFTGSDDSGLTDVTEARVDFDYQLQKDLSTSLYASYIYEDIVNPRGEFLVSAIIDRGTAAQDSITDLSYTRESIKVGARLNYSFLRWYVFSIRYDFYTQDGDLAQDNYDDHRVAVQISASKELWKW